jgi:hypothetical protein
MKQKSNPNGESVSFIDNLDEEKWSTIPGLKELALKATSRIQRDPGWAGHIFSTDDGRINGILLYNKSLPTFYKRCLLAVNSNNPCEKDK